MILYRANITFARKPVFPVTHFPAGTVPLLGMSRCTPIDLSVNGCSQMTLNFSISGSGIRRTDSRSSATAGIEEETAAECSHDAAEPDNMPELAAHERSRCLKRKMTAGPRGRSKAIAQTKETKVSLHRRLHEFPDAGLTVSANQLFCLACREVLPNLKETIRRHLISAKHIAKKNKYDVLHAQTNNLHTDLAEWFAENADIKGVSSCTTTTTIVVAVVVAMYCSAYACIGLESFSPSCRHLYPPRFMSYDTKLSGRF